MITMEVPEIEIVVQIILKFKPFDRTQTFLIWSTLHLWGNHTHTHTPALKIHCGVHSTIIQL